MKSYANQKFSLHGEHCTNHVVGRLDGVGYSQAGNCICDETDIQVITNVGSMTLYCGNATNEVFISWLKQFQHHD
jgi:hypothetical protein